MDAGHLLIVGKPFSKLRWVGAKVATWHDVVIRRNVSLIENNKDVMATVLHSL